MNRVIDFADPLPPDGMVAAVAQLRRERAAAGRDGSFAIAGGISVYIGQSAAWLPDGFVTGTPERLAEQVLAEAALGATHIQVRFASRSCTELLDQIEAWAKEVAPLT